MLAALEGNCSIPLRMILIIILWTVQAQVMVIRSMIYSLFIGAFPIRPNPSPSRVKGQKPCFVLHLHVPVALDGEDLLANCPECDDYRLSRGLPVERSIAGNN